MQKRKKCINCGKYLRKEIPGILTLNKLRSAISKAFGLDSIESYWFCNEKCITNYKNKTNAELIDLLEVPSFIRKEMDGNKI